MDNNVTARKLAELGKREAGLMRQLARVQAERCALLQSVAQESALDADVVALSIAPKDDD